MVKVPGKPSGAVRLRHIAQLTNLSQATISKVLNGKEGVSEKNRKKIQRVIDELGFRRWPMMQSSENVLSTASVITYSSAAFGDIFYEKILRTILEEGQRCGVAIDVNLLMASPDTAPPLLFQNSSPEAVIMLGVDHPLVFEQVASLGCPAVLANSLDYKMRFDSVSSDYYLGGILATQHLLDLGHRDIIHVGTSRRMTFDLRRLGFISALEQAGVAYTPERNLVDIGLQELSAIDENQLAAQIIADGKLRASAFFAVSDTVAMSLIHTLNSNGFSVPGDASVIGFDDLPISAHCTPPLTTMHAKRLAMGKVAVQMLLERAASPQKDISRVSLGIELIQRESASARAS